MKNKYTIDNREDNQIKLICICGRRNESNDTSFYFNHTGIKAEARDYLIDCLNSMPLGTSLTISEKLAYDLGIYSTPPLPDLLIANMPAEIDYTNKTEWKVESI